MTLIMITLVYKLFCPSLIPRPNRGLCVTYSSSLNRARCGTLLYTEVLVSDEFL